MRNFNKPQRYNVASIQAQQTLGGDVMQSHAEGQYVTWSDYSWLLAELTNLKSEADHLKAEVERLKAEVERLRKAGDAMANLLSCAGSPPNVVQSWNAAKDGKPTE